MKITIEMPAQRIADLMITAIETGIGYWAEDVQVWSDGRRVPYAEASSYEGAWTVKGKYPEDDAGEDMADFEFDAVQFAARVIHAPHSLTDWIIENEDAGSADALFQVAAFGEVVFG